MLLSAESSIDTEGITPTSADAGPISRDQQQLKLKHRQHGEDSSSLSLDPVPLPAYNTDCA